MLVMSKYLSLFEVKARLAEVVDQVVRTHERVTMTRNGHPEVVILSVGDLEVMEETLELLSDPVAMREIEEGRNAIERGDFVGRSELEALRSRLSGA